MDLARSLERSPSALEAMETGIIGAIFVHGKLALDTVGRLEPRHFSSKPAELIFKSITARNSRNEPFAPMFVVRDLGGLLTASDALRMVEGASPLLCVPDYAAEIRRAGTCRLIQEAAAAGKVSEVAKLAAEASTVAASSRGTDDRLSAMFQDFDDIANGKTSRSAITTGLADLDRQLGAMMGGDMIILAGRPGMGKTTVAGRIAVAAAEAGHPVLLFSHEMTTEQVYQRISTDIAYSRGTHIPYTDYRAGKLTRDQLAYLQEMVWQARQWPLDVIDGTRTIGQIKSEAKAWFETKSKSYSKTGLLIVDYLGLVVPEDRYRGNRVQEVSEISGGGKAIAKDLGVCSLFLSQLSRKVEEREDKRPFLSDLRDSGSIEQDADTVIFAYRDAYYLRQQIEGEHDAEARMRLMDRLEAVEHEIELIVAKSRHGPTGTVRAFCAIEYAAIRDLARNHGGDPWG